MAQQRSSAGREGIAAKARATARGKAGAAAAYPGAKFGLPQQGPGSVASMSRRFLALFVDWLICLVIVSGLAHSSYWAHEWQTLVLFSVEVYVLTAFTGITIGKRVLGIRVMRTDGSRPGFGWAAVRTLLLLTVIPALLSDRDLRGLHDRASDTIVVRL